MKQEALHKALIDFFLYHNHAVSNISLVDLAGKYNQYANGAIGAMSLIIHGEAAHDTRIDHYTFLRVNFYRGVIAFEEYWQGMEPPTSSSKRTVSALPIAEDFTRGKSVLSSNTAVTMLRALIEVLEPEVSETFVGSFINEYLHCVNNPDLWWCFEFINTAAHGVRIGIGYRHGDKFLYPGIIAESRS